MMTLDDLEPL